MIYAQINGDNICIGISQLSGAISSADMIAISSFDQSLIGQKYADGEWIENEPEPVPEPPTEQELIQAELLLNQTQILINQDQQDTVLAELLLNQIGGI